MLFVRKEESNGPHNDAHYLSQAHCHRRKSHQCSILHIGIRGRHEVLAQHSDQPLDLVRVVGVAEVLHHPERTKEHRQSSLHEHQQNLFVTNRYNMKSVKNRGSWQIYVSCHELINRIEQSHSTQWGTFAEKHLLFDLDTSELSLVVDFVAQPADAGYA